MESQQIQFRAVGPLGADLRGRKAAGFPVSEIARRDLERYYYLLRASLPTFTMDEAMILVNAFAGYLTTPETVHILWAEVEDFLMDQGNKEQKQLVTRLLGLSLFECMAVADAVERAWNDETYHISNMQARVQKVGLVK